jgi:hypothetical protein
VGGRGLDSSGSEERSVMDPYDLWDAVSFSRRTQLRGIGLYLLYSFMYTKKCLFFPALLYTAEIADSFPGSYATRGFNRICTAYTTLSGEQVGGSW